MLKVLIVDGDLGKVGLYEEVFTLPGYQVTTSLRTFQDAIEWFLKNDIVGLDIVLIDESVVSDDLEFKYLFQIVQALMEKGFRGMCIVCADIPHIVEGVTWLQKDEKGIVDRLASVLTVSVAS